MRVYNRDSAILFVKNFLQKLQEKYEVNAK